MDNLDCCNVCEVKINIDDDVIVTSDAKVVGEAVVGERTTEFELPDNENYRGMYCPDCWQELMRLEYKLWEKKGKKRAKQNPDGTAPSKLAMFEKQFKAIEELEQEIKEKSMDNTGTLVKNDDFEEDYTLDSDANGVWVEVNNVSVNIIKRNDGVGVKLYHLRHEDEDCLAEVSVDYPAIDAPEYAEEKSR